MKNLHINNKIKGIVVIVIMSFLVLSCGTTMNVVNKSLDDGQLVSTDATATGDFLNEYDLHLPHPKQERIGIDIALERPNVFAHGDKLYAQIALTTKKPIVEKKQIHILVYNPEIESASHRNAFQNSVESVKAGMAQLPPGSKLTVDCYNPIKGNLGIKSALLTYKNYSNLVSFLADVAKLHLEGRHHHFLLLLGSGAALSHEQKQNIIDIASILQIKAETLSILSVGQSPEVAFLAAVAKKGHGLFVPATKKFDYSKWYENFNKYVSAKSVSDIKLDVSTLNKTVISSIQTPQSVEVIGNNIEEVVPVLREGHQYAVVVELTTPGFSSFSVVPVINVEAQYFDNDANRYVTIHKTATVHIVNNRNALLVGKSSTVERSLLILGTQRVLQNIVPVIQDNRYYRAVALLTTQSQKLNRFGKKHNDLDLLNDAKILDQYSNKLYGYDQKWFQNLSLWHDFTLESGRYSEQFD